MTSDFHGLEGEPDPETLCFRRDGLPAGGRRAAIDPTRLAAGRPKGGAGGPN